MNIGKSAITGAAAAVLLTLSNALLAGANDYVFELVKSEIKSSNVGTIAVRLLHKPTERPVPDAVIVQTRIAMAHEGGAEMDAAFVPLGSPKPGVYAFRAPLTMVGSWFLSIAAKVPGEPEMVVGKITFRVVP
jgi:YtkA-like